MLEARRTTNSLSELPCERDPGFNLSDVPRPADDPVRSRWRRQHAICQAAGVLIGYRDRRAVDLSRVALDRAVATRSSHRRRPRRSVRVLLGADPAESIEEHDLATRIDRKRTWAIPDPAASSQ